MNAEQLTMLKDLHGLMSDFPEERKFNMSSWVQWGKTREEINCNTVCCAAGWGVSLLPSWSKKLRLTRDGHIFNRDFQGAMDDSALCFALGLDFQEIEYLFYPSEYIYRKGNRIPIEDITTKIVADHIATVLLHYGEIV